MKVWTRRRWKNDAGTQQVVPLRTYKPSTLQDFIQIVQQAEQLGVRVHAVGSGHSFSEVAVSPDFIVLPGGLQRIIRLDTDVLKDPSNTASLVELQSGVTLRKLNQHLDRIGLALPNMGGYDGQTIVGATATSTHGSGLEFGPLSEVIRSYDVVAAGGHVLRVEPAGGITDPVRFAQKYGGARRLVQNDAAFSALGVGLGCLGLVYSVVIEAIPGYWLEEVRVLGSWESVRQLLIQGDVLRGNRHYEVLINPYRVNGSHTCLVTRRNRVEAPEGVPVFRQHRNVIAELLSSLSVTGRVLRSLFNSTPSMTPALIERALHGLQDSSYVNTSHQVLNVGAANELDALSGEYGFPMQDDRYLEAIDSLLNVAEMSCSVGNAYQTGPIAIRFVRGTSFFMSPQYSRNTAMAEVIVVSGTISAEEMLYRYEEAAYQFDGRPHLGQVNHVAGQELVGELYPGVESWRAARRAYFDPHGTFDGPLSRRLGLATV